MIQTTIVLMPVAGDMVGRLFLSSASNGLLATAVWEGWPEPDKTDLEFQSSGALARNDVEYPAGAGHISTIWKN